MARKSRAVLLDRDGTINEDRGYLSDPAELVLIPGAARAVKRLNDLGVKVIVITNQSGVGRGYFTESDLESVNRRLAELLEAEGARIDGVYYCTHRPDEGCECRKPRSGMAKAAALDHDFDPAAAFVVGDKASDVELAWSFGARGVLVTTGYGSGELSVLKRPPDYTAPDIGTAVDWIIGELAKDKP